ncbi:unnamed protein product [Trichogramma brassicae]|uniref:Uncharacterized protein n=1 Tax=Trichogramma brassicae TaxID=86971 RepID=A0A6H5IWI5_9HYME|nr:unnamed protein product [Trichogramma brassicae]
MYGNGLCFSCLVGFLILLLLAALPCKCDDKSVVVKEEESNGNGSSLVGGKSTARSTNPWLELMYGLMVNYDDNQQDLLLKYLPRTGKGRYSRDHRLTKSYLSGLQPKFPTSTSITIIIIILGRIQKIINQIRMQQRILGGHPSGACVYTRSVHVHTRQVIHVNTCAPDSDYRRQGWYIIDVLAILTNNQTVKATARRKKTSLTQKIYKYLHHVFLHIVIGKMVFEMVEKMYFLTSAALCCCLATLSQQAAVQQSTTGSATMTTTTTTSKSSDAGGDLGRFFDCLYEADSVACTTKRIGRELDRIEAQVTGNKPSDPPISRVIEETSSLLAEGLQSVLHKDDPAKSQDETEAGEGARALDSADQVESRKKKGKGKKKHLHKAMMVGMMVKAKLSLLLQLISTHFQFKFYMIAIISLLINMARFWLDLKKSHRPSKVIYYEHAQHQHHYDHDDDHGVWGRSSDESPQDIAYNAYAPDH